MHVIHYTVDDEEFTTTERTLTPRVILENAGLDPTTHYLELHEGNHTISYKDNMDEPIHMHEGMVFSSVDMGPAPLSHL